MKLDEVMTEIAQALQSITKLRVTDYPPQTVVPPAGYVSYPEQIMFDEEYGRGGDQFNNLPIVLVASKVTTRAARDTVAAWASGDGPKSVKAALEAWDWQTCDNVQVTDVQFDTELIAQVSYLVAIFKATVVGPGKED